jgi:hypothetical protein
MDRLVSAWKIKQKAGPAKFDGTMRGLVDIYQTDPDSRYHGIRYKNRIGITNMLKRIVVACGTWKLAEMGARDFKRLYEGFRWPDGKSGRQLIATAYDVMNITRMVIKHGSVYEVDPNCSRLKAILHDMTFEKGKSGTEIVTLKQSEDLVAAAHAAGLHSIALAQELQRNLGIRQKDAIGEWVPTAEPGISVIIYRKLKWIAGISWDEISNDFILTHKMSKSRTGKVIEFDLKLYPTVMAELLRVPEDQRHGAVVKSESTGQPWFQQNFARNWRILARKVKIPEAVKNKDNRAGNVTEVIRATGGNIEAARIQAGHSSQATTRIYSRDHLQSTSDTAVIVADFRAKNSA